MMTYYDDIRKVQDLHLPWEILTDINILIVGASGLIGRALVDTLMQLPDKNVSSICRCTGFGLCAKLFHAIQG